MKKLMIGLPLAILLAHCSGPNNTQTTDTEIDATSTASTSPVITDNMAATSDIGTTTNTSIATDEATTGIHSDRMIGNVAVDHSTSVISPLPLDPDDPMTRHWERTNAQHWTWDYDYPGFDRPVAGSYNTAVNGNWQLVMTPELVTAWREDNSRSLWLHDGETYLSASESFNTRNNVNGSVNAGVDLNAGVTAEGSADLATDESGSVINNSLNSAATKDGAYSSTYDPESNQHPRTGGEPVEGTVEGSVTTTTGTNATGVNTEVSGTVTGSAGNTGTAQEIDVNSISYNAYNGNMYQLPRFNLYLDNGSFTGYTGCNGISGRVEVSGNSLRFLNTTPSTAIECMGGFDESQLTEMLGRVDSYTYVGEELHLMQGNQVLLKFRKEDLNTTLK